MKRRTAIRIASALAASALTLTTLAACDGFTPPGWVAETPASTATGSATPTATCSTFGFESVFSQYGSVHYTLILAPGLTLYTDMWTEQLTHDWTATSDKQLNYVINVVDTHANEDDPFSDKRKVYMSELSVTANTVQKSGATTAAYKLDDDPRDITLDPEALQSKKYGLLITSPKGGFQYEKTEIGQVPDDTYGLNMDFALTMSTQTAKGSKKYTTDTYTFTLPIAIFDASNHDDSTSCATNATLEPSYAPGAEG